MYYTKESLRCRERTAGAPFEERLAVPVAFDLFCKFYVDRNIA